MSVDAVSLGLDGFNESPQMGDHSVLGFLDDRTVRWKTDGESRILEKFIPCIPQENSWEREGIVHPLMSSCSRAGVEWDYENGRVTVWVEADKKNDNNQDADKEREVDRGTERESDDKPNSNDRRGGRRLYS